MRSAAVLSGGIKNLATMTSLAAAFSARSGVRFNPLGPCRDGQAVNEWVDLKTGDLAFEYTSTNSPSFSAASSGFPAVTFDGTNRRLTTRANTNKVSITAGLTAYVVVNASNAGSIWERYTGTALENLRMSRSGLQVGGLFPAAGYTVNPSTIAILAATWDQATKRQINYLNGAIRIPASSSITGGTLISGGILQHSGTPVDAASSVRITIGARNDLAQDYSGSIYEIWLANAAHSDAERQAIEGQLAEFYGLRASLPADHPHYLA